VERKKRTRPAEDHIARVKMVDDPSADYLAAGAFVSVDS